MARKRLLTKKEVADRLRISTRTLDRRIAGRQFPAGFGDAAELYWLEEDVEAYLHLQSRISGGMSLDPAQQVPEQDSE